MFVEYLEPAHNTNQKFAKWRHSTIPNWPHLKEQSNRNMRYDCIEVSAVEGVHFVAPDSCNPGYFWAVLNTGNMLWHERYADTDEGEEGDLLRLEPDAFLMTRTQLRDSAEPPPLSESRAAGAGARRSSVAQAAADEYAADAAADMEDADMSD